MTGARGAPAASEFGALGPNLLMLVHQTQNPNLCVVVVAYNSAGVISQCLESVLGPQNADASLVVVDNASSDGTASLVRNKFPSVRLLANSENFGFGKANNQVFSSSGAKYFFLLNPDATVSSRTLRVAIEFMEAYPKIGLAGCRIVNPDGSAQDSVSLRYPGQKYADSSFDRLPGRIACVLGAAIIIRGDVLRELNGFDEEFFLYGEDQDLCLRIRKAGYEIGFIEDAFVTHIGGASESKSDPGDVWRKKARAELLFYRKHYSAPAITRLQRRVLASSRWRILSLELGGLFTPISDKNAAKIAKYRAIREIYSSAVD